VRASALLIVGAVSFAAPALGQGAPTGKLLQDSAGECTDRLPFNHVLTEKPLPVYKADATITEAVATFHCTGKNPYAGDPQAIADGKKLYAICATCHMPDGSGRMGPSLVDNVYKYERVATDHGEFEVIYGGAAGAMQAMGRRFDQDQILRIMAYVGSLPRK
jgi:cytochrome c-L